jgi:hypothetical protein
MNVSSGRIMAGGGGASCRSCNVVYVEFSPRTAGSENMMNKAAKIVIRNDFIMVIRCVWFLEIASSGDSDGGQTISEVRAAVE